MTKHNRFLSPCIFVCLACVFALDMEDSFWVVSLLPTYTDSVYAVLPALQTLLWKPASSGFESSLFGLKAQVQKVMGNDYFDLERRASAIL